MLFRSFLIFEDRKFADIGHIVQQQYEKGIYKIAEWADISNCHITPGSGCIEALNEIAIKHQHALLLIAQLSSKDNLCDHRYISKAKQYAEKYSQSVIGFICQQQIHQHTKWLHITPGIHTHTNNDKLGQQYHSPEQSIQRSLTDIIIEIGRASCRERV